MSPLVLLLALAQAAPEEEAVLIRGGRILTLAGPDLVRGSVLIRGGKIAAVAEEMEVPEGARVVDAAGRVLMPGLVDAGPAGVPGGSVNEDGSEVTPLVRALDAVDLAAPFAARLRRSGVTTLFVGPGNRNVIGGLGAVVKTAAGPRTARILREDAALKGAIGSLPSSDNYPPRTAMPGFFGRRPTTRMGVEWEFRKAFEDVLRKTSAGTTLSNPERVLARAARGELPVHVAASRATDLETALRLSRDLGFRLVIEEGHEAWKLADALASVKAAVLLRPTLHAGRQAPEGSETRLDAFARLREAGVQVALLPAGEDESGTLLVAAAFAVRHGAGREDALRAVTAVPAGILGVGDRVGTLEAGKDADLLVLSGDPLDVTTRVERVFVNGREAAPGR